MSDFTLFKSGGMADLYEVEYQGKPCIKKKMKIGDAQDSFNRFRTEYELLSKIDSPFVVKVYDIDGSSYIMERADCDLEEYIENNNLTTEKKTTLINEIIGGIEALHKQNIVHRDLKPGNILIFGGHAKVSDLGISKLLTSHTNTTVLSKRSELGSVRYMCDGQMNGDRPSVYFDIFALSKIIYFIEEERTPPIGHITEMNSENYKSLVLSIQNEKTTPINNISKLKEKIEVLKNIPKDVQLVLDTKYGFNEGGIDIYALFEIVDKNSNSTFDFLERNFDKIYSKIQPKDNDALNLLYKHYKTAVDVYVSQNMWSFSATLTMCKNFIKIYEKASNDLLKQQSLLSAFEYPCLANRWEALRYFVAYTKSENLYDLVSDILITNNQDYYDNFIEYYSGTRN